MGFKKITPEDYPFLKRFFKNQRYELCAYSLASILAWSNESYQPYAAVKGDCLIICAEFTFRPENRHLILPVSPVRSHSPEELQDIALNLGFDCYRFIPQGYIEEHGRHLIESFFDLEEQTEYADYIYLTADIAGLKGNKYSKKRNLINQFKRHYVDKSRVRIETISPAVAAECIDFLEKWCAEHNCEMDQDEDLACEKQAAISTIENIRPLEVSGILLRVDGVVSAFGIASHLTDSMGVLHFEKAFTGIKGLYQFFDNACAKRLFKGYKYLNKESDMNIPGLAKAKKSYYPVKMVKSYKLTVK